MNKSSQSSPDLTDAIGLNAPLDPSRWGLIEEPSKLKNPSRKLLSKLLDQVYSTAVEELDLYRKAGIEEGAEIDVVFSGGGLRGYYCCGAYVILNALVNAHGLKIRRISGASAGAWCSVFMACDTHPLDWADTYYESMNVEHQVLLDGYRSFIPTMLSKMLPEDAYLRCSGKIFLSITTVSLFGGLKNKVVSEFTSNEDLIAACFASCTIPFLSTTEYLYKFRGEYVLDGGTTNNLPVFTDNKRRQIVFDLSKVEYPFALSFAPSDRCVEALILRGAVEMRLFLQNVHKKKGNKKLKSTVILWGKGNEAYGVANEMLTAMMKLTVMSIFGFYTMKMGIQYNIRTPLIEVTTKFSKLIGGCVVTVFQKLSQI
jgi:hypothetical protein